MTNDRQLAWQRWSEALSQFAAAQLEAGVAASTTHQRVKNVRRFAATLELSPWHVLEADVAAWLEAESERVSRSTCTALRVSLRAFYRWGHTTGRVTVDPTAGADQRARRLPVPAQWVQPLTAYERHLHARGDAPETIKLYMERLRGFARELNEHDPFGVTLDDLYEWMAGKQWSRETRRGNKSSLRGFYGWAVDTERMRANPTTKLPRVKAGDPVARPATDAEYSGALERASDERWSLALRLAAELGMRRGEVARVHTVDLQDTGDGSHSWLTVHGKGGKLRRLPVPPGLVAILRARPAGYLFPGQVVERQAHAVADGHLSARYLGKRISELLPPGVTMHTLRHRFATRAYSVDHDAFTVQRLLGHASPATTIRYVQVSDERMRALVDAVAS